MQIGPLDTTRNSHRLQLAVLWTLCGVHLVTFVSLLQVRLIARRSQTLMHLLIGCFPSQTLLSVRQLQLNSVNNMAWRVKPDEVLIEVGKLFGSKIGLQKLNYEVRDRRKGFESDFKRLFSVQNFSLTQFGVNSGRGSIISCGSVPQPQGVTTIGVFKGERVAIKKISKKKVRRSKGRGRFSEKSFLTAIWNLMQI